MWKGYEARLRAWDQDGLAHAYLIAFEKHGLVFIAILHLIRHSPLLAFRKTCCCSRVTGSTATMYRVSLARPEIKLYHFASLTTTNSLDYYCEGGRGVAGTILPPWCPARSPPIPLVHLDVPSSAGARPCYISSHHFHPIPSSPSPSSSQSRDTRPSAFSLLHLASFGFSSLKKPCCPHSCVTRTFFTGRIIPPASYHAPKSVRTPARDAPPYLTYLNSLLLSNV